MDNAFGKIISILIIITMMFIVPLKYYMDKNQSLEEMYVSTKTIEFVDSVRNTGFITKDMYDQFQKLIFQMNRLYIIELEHIKYSVFEQEIVKEKYFSSEISESIYSQGIYYFKIEDYFKIKVIGVSSNNLISYYGGFIKNETY